MRILIATTICLVMISATARQSSGAEAVATIVPNDWKPLHDRWQKAVDELKVPGLAVVAVRGDRIVLLDAIGVCDPKGKQPLTPRSPFYLASVTKSFTALGVAILVEEGKINLDEPVKSYLPRFTLADRELAATITVRELLCHRYGLSSEPITMAEAYFGNITEDRYYGLLAAVEPLDRFSYTNLHYTLAGRIIEAVSGKPWKDFLAERVFDPLTMRDATCYASRLYANPRAAWPIVEQGGQWTLSPLVKTDAVMHAAGGMGASAADLANWLRFQLTGKAPDGRRLVSTEMLDQIHAQQTTSERRDSDSAGFRRDGYSLGWFTGAYRDRPLREHGGGYLGTSTYVSFLPEDNVGVAVLVNESVPNIGIARGVAGDVYAQLLNEPPVDCLPEVRRIAQRLRKLQDELDIRPWQAPSASKGLTQPIDRYVGTYENQTFGEAMVAREDDRLSLKVGTLRLRWHAEADDRFRIEIPPSDMIPGQFNVGTDDQVVGFEVTAPEGTALFRKTNQCSTP